MYTFKCFYDKPKIKFACLNNFYSAIKFNTYLDFDKFNFVNIQTFHACVRISDINEYPVSEDIFIISETLFSIEKH